MRWLQNDPLGLAAGNNQYEAVNNRPTTEVDPLGLFTAQGDKKPQVKPKDSKVKEFYCDNDHKGYTVVYTDKKGNLEFGLYCDGKQFIGILRQIGAKKGLSFGACVYPFGKNVTFFGVYKEKLSSITWFNFEVIDKKDMAVIIAKWQRLLKAYPGNPSTAADAMRDWFASTKPTGGSQYVKQGDDAYNMRLYQWYIATMTVKEYGLRPKKGGGCEWFVDRTLPLKNVELKDDSPPKENTRPKK